MTRDQRPDGTDRQALLALARLLEPERTKPRSSTRRAFVDVGLWWAEPLIPWAHRTTLALRLEPGREGFESPVLFCLGGMASTLAANLSEIVPALLQLQYLSKRHDGLEAIRQLDWDSLAEIHRQLHGDMAVFGTFRELVHGPRLLGVSWRDWDSPEVIRRWLEVFRAARPSSESAAFADLCDGILDGSSVELADGAWEAASHWLLQRDRRSGEGWLTQPLSLDSGVSSSGRPLIDPVHRVSMDVVDSALARLPHEHRWSMPLRTAMAGGERCFDPLLELSRDLRREGDFLGALRCLQSLGYWATRHVLVTPKELLSGARILAADAGWTALERRWADWERALDD